jgi:hypothetical protein
MIPALLIGHLLPGNKVDALHAKFFERLELFNKLVPFRNRDKHFEGFGKKHS